MISLSGQALQVKDWMGAKIDGARLDLAQRQLRKDLGTIIELAKGHKDAGTPSGDPRLTRLYDKALAVIDAYCAKHGGTREDVLNAAPGVLKLQEWAIPEPSTAVKILGYSAVTMVGVFAVTTVVALLTAWVIFVVHVTLH